MMDNLGLLSKDSRCYSFDERGNGYARGEGVGVLVIRPLEDAVRDGDTVRAVIRSSASNQDGRTPGITLPSTEMQATLIQEVYRKAGLDMATTRYFEAHGTGLATTISTILYEIQANITQELPLEIQLRPQPLGLCFDPITL